MVKKLDPKLIEIFKEYNMDANECLWDCHGSWVAYHRAVEEIGAKAGVSFSRPEILERESEKGIVAVLCFGKLKDREEWSVGECSPKNNKNAYPYAMAEKRAKDRVILKLVGLHGHVYSEEESDDFKVSMNAQRKWWDKHVPDLRQDLLDVKSHEQARKLFGDWWKEMQENQLRGQDWKSVLESEFNPVIEQFKEAAE